MNKSPFKFSDKKILSGHFYDLSLLTALHIRKLTNTLPMKSVVWTQYEKQFYNQQTSMNIVDYRPYSRSSENIENMRTEQETSSSSKEGTTSI